MVIHELVVHLIEKMADSSTAQVSISSSSISDSPVLEKFLEELNKVYNSKSNKILGGFTSIKDDTADTPASLEQGLTAYLAHDTDFLQFSQAAMKRLKYYIEQASKATGGYVVFIHYTLFGSEFVLIAMMNNSSGVTVNQNLEINRIDYLDISRLHLAARIDLSEWQEASDSDRYISMIRTKESHKLSEYFRKFIGSDENSNSQQETSQLFTAVNQFCDKEFSDSEEKSQFKKKAADYCLEQADKGQNVDLKDFSTYVAEGVVDDFMKYVQSEQFELNNEIAPSKTTIRRFNKITGRNAQISITLDEEALGQSVIFDPEKETLTILEVPASLKAQLLNR
jgi:nucleoid-associated protein